MQIDNTPRCGRCNRKLKNVKAIEAGFGKVCHGKMLAEQMMANQIKLDLDDGQGHKEAS